MSFYKPSYGSSISFQAKNLEWRGINGELNVSPLGVNSIRADLRLIYTQNEPRTIGLIKKINKITSTKGSAGQKEFDGIVNSVNFTPESETENRRNFTANLDISGFSGDYSLEKEPDSLITQNRQIINFEDGNNLYVDFDYETESFLKKIFYVDGFTQNYQYLEGYYLEYPKRNDILSLDFVDFFLPNQNSENDLFASMNYDASRDIGYFGEVSGSDLISGDDLATEINLTAGTAQNSDAGWLKFYVGPNASCNRQGGAYILYVAKKSMRHSISWGDIDNVGGVYGTTEVEINGKSHKVRLMQGADADPYTFASLTSCIDNAGSTSEWNELFYRVSEKIPDCSNSDEGMEGGFSTILHGGPQNGSNWADFTNSELNVEVGNGNASWCQEKVDGSDPSLRVFRGRLGVASFSTVGFTSAGSPLGWRPCLQIDASQSQEMGAINVKTGAMTQDFGLSYVVSGSSGLVQNFTGNYFLLQNEDFSGYLNIDNFNKSIQYSEAIDSWFLFDFSKNGTDIISGYTSFIKYGKSDTEKYFFNNYFPNSGFYLIDLDKLDTNPVLEKFTGYSEFKSLDGEQFTIQSDTGINNLDIEETIFTIYSKDNSENKKIYYDYRKDEYFAYDLNDYPPQKGETLDTSDLFQSDDFVFYENFYNSFEGSQVVDCSVRDISDDVFETTINLMNNRVAPILKNGMGFIKDKTLEISTGVNEFKKHDVYKIPEVESGLDYNFYTVEDNSVVLDQNKLNTLFTDLTKTGIYEGLTRAFPFHPDQGIDLLYDHSKRINEFKNSFIEQLNVGFNQNRIQPIEVAFSNRTDKEAYAILHYLETHLGYRKFAFLNKQNILDTEINPNKFFFCPTWKHNFNYKDSNTIEATFVEVIDPII